MIDLLRSRSSSWWVLVLRLATGVVLVAVSLSKFTRHEDLVESFDEYGIPLEDAAVYLAGTVELAGGVLLVAGLFVRPAAAIVALQMVVALLTGGRVDTDLYHVGLGSVLLVASVVLVWMGAGPWSLDARLARSSPR